MIDQKTVRELFDYDPENGVLIWKTPHSTKLKPGDIAGNVRKDGYTQIVIGHESYLAHRLIWLYHKGYLPENDIDHEDRDNTNDRIWNLREATRSCNNTNSGNRKDNNSGVKGVIFHKTSKKWMAYITKNKRTTYLGVHKEYIEAVCYRLAAEQCLNWCNPNSPAFEYLKEYIQITQYKPKVRRLF